MLLKAVLLDVNTLHLLLLYHGLFIMLLLLNCLHLIKHSKSITSPMNIENQFLKKSRFNDVTTGKLQDQHLMVQLKANFDTFILLDKVCTCFPAALLLGLLPPWLSLDSGLLSCPCSAIRASNSSRVNSFSGAKIDRGSLQMSIWRDWSDQERTCRNVVLKSWLRM